MKLKKIACNLGVLILLSVLLSACGASKDEPYGTVYEVMEQEQRVDVNISAWSAEVGLKDKYTDVLITRTVEITDELLLKFEDGETAAIEDLVVGQEVQMVVEEETDEVKELILLEE